MKYPSNQDAFDSLLKDAAEDLRFGGSKLQKNRDTRKEDLEEEVICRNPPFRCAIWRFPEQDSEWTCPAEPGP